MTHALKKVTVAFGLLICVSLANADCWRLTNHRLMRTNAGVKPNAEGAKPEPCPVELTPAEQRNISLLKTQQAAQQRERELQVRRELAEKGRATSAIGR